MSKENSYKSYKGMLYIAYGSNLNISQMKQRCPNSVIVGTSEIKDYELVFRGSKTGSYATIEPCEGKTVPVALWKTTVIDEVALDYYEGYPNFYTKEEMDIKLNGAKISAYVYIMPQSHALGMPSNSYIESILEGYETAGFDPQIIYDAVADTEQKMSGEQTNIFEMKW